VRLWIQAVGRDDQRIVLVLAQCRFRLNQVQSYSASRYVVFHGQRMSCAQVYQVSEDQEFAGTFQDLRRKALKMRSTISELQSAIGDLNRLDNVNSTLHASVYAVEAFDLVVGFISGKSAGQALLSKSGIGMGVVAEALKDFAKMNARDIQAKRTELKNTVDMASRYADHWYAESNGVINKLTDSRRVLKQQCR
jgi:hypothetical protein